MKSIRSYFHDAFGGRSASSVDDAPAGSSLAEAHERMLLRMIELAHDLGVKQERARIAAILNSPVALPLPRLAWRLAKDGSLTYEQAEEALRLARVEMLGNGDEAPAGATIN